MGGAKDGWGQLPPEVSAPTKTRKGQQQEALDNPGSVKGGAEDMHGEKEHIQGLSSVYEITWGPFQGYSYPHSAGCLALEGMALLQQSQPRVNTEGRQGEREGSGEPKRATVQEAAG